MWQQGHLLCSFTYFRSHRHKSFGASLFHLMYFDLFLGSSRGSFTSSFFNILYTEGCPSEILFPFMFPDIPSGPQSYSVQR